MSERYYLKPLILCAGGKSWMREIIWKYYSQASKDRNTDLRLVEPFCGGASVSLYILPEKCWLNDKGEYLINFYNYIKEHGKMPSFDHLNDLDDFSAKNHYLKTRNDFNNLIKNGITSGEELATTYYYLNRAGYGGLSRFNSKGEFNVPFRGKISNARTDFVHEQEVFKDWDFTNLDFTEVLDKVKDDDFLFVDPPYDETFNKYIQAGFNWDQQVILAEKLAKLSNPIVATNSTTERIIKLYTDLGFDLRFRMRGNFIQRPKVKNGNYKDFKEAVFTKNIKTDD